MVLRDMSPPFSQSDSLLNKDTIPCPSTSSLYFFIGLSYGDQYELGLHNKTSCFKYFTCRITFGPQNNLMS